MISVMIQRKCAASQAPHPGPSAAQPVSKRRKEKRFSTTFKEVPKEVACSESPFHLKFYERENVSRWCAFVFC